MPPDWENDLKSREVVFLETMVANSETNVYIQVTCVPWSYICEFFFFGGGGQWY